MNRKGLDMTQKDILAACISLLANVAVVTAPHVGSAPGWNTIVRTFKAGEKAQAVPPAQEHADGGLL
jgi:hypothetical protein